MRGEQRKLPKSISIKARSRGKHPKTIEGIKVKEVHDYVFFACKFGQCADCTGTFIRKVGLKKGELHHCECRHHVNVEQCKVNARKKRRKRSA